jgi:multiple sugar transport system permease protein
MIKKASRQKFKKNLLRVIVTAFLLLISVTMLLPFIWMLSASFKVEADVLTYPIQWIPSRWNVVQNYSTVWNKNSEFILYYWNSIKITVLATLLQVTVSAMGAYAFAKIKFRFREGLFLVYLSMMMIPDQVTVVPKFLVFRQFGLYDTHLGLILLASFSIYGIFLLKQFMMTIPDSLLESARIDGAGHARIFTQIILPISKPALATLMILKFVWTWNDYQNPLIFLSTQSKFTIQLGITQFMTQYGSTYSLMMVVAVSSIIPLIIIFLIGQKYIIEGMTSGAVKG